MRTNDIKKGTRILLSNGWYATMMDNKKGNIRTAEVEGYYTEIGSIYSFNIYQALVDNKWVDIEYSQDQLKCKQMNQLLFS